MQQTDKYKLNKPGVDDPITPLPLNENMDKIEAAILGEAAERAAGDAALSQRLQVFEAKRFVWGVVNANYQATVTLDFTPELVFVYWMTNWSKIWGANYRGSSIILPVKIVDNGFILKAIDGNAGYPGDYLYLALA